MFEFVIPCVSILRDLAVVSCIGFCAYKYFKISNFLRNNFIKYKLNIMDPLLDTLISKDIKSEGVEGEDSEAQIVEVQNVEAEVSVKKERMIAFINCGSGVEYLGSNISVSRIEKMNSNEINELYLKYERRLGSFMAKSLGKYFLETLSVLALHVLPIRVDNQKPLLCDLEKDPFIGTALNGICCSLFHKYGMFLAPITGALTTLKYCEFEKKPSHCCPPTTPEDTPIDSDL